MYPDNIKYIQSKRLLKLRFEKNLSQKQLAEYLCCTQQQVSLYEKGKHEIPFWRLRKLCNVYNLKIESFLS